MSNTINGEEEDMSIRIFLIFNKFLFIITFFGFINSYYIFYIMYKNMFLILFYLTICITYFGNLNQN